MTKLQGALLLAYILFALNLASLAIASVKGDGQQQRPGFPPQYIEGLRQKWGWDWGFAGISTFAHLPHVRCLIHPEQRFDIAILGAPFDTTNSYRSDGRFGPRSIRIASSRQNSYRGFNTRAAVNPYLSEARILDCGDIQISPIANALALEQMSEGLFELGRRPPAHATVRSGKTRIISLGGDHLISLAALRALKKVHNKRIAVVRFSAHYDGWPPSAFRNTWDGKTSEYNHESTFWLADEEGLIMKEFSAFVGLRDPLESVHSVNAYSEKGHSPLLLENDAIDDIGSDGVAKAIIDRVGNETAVYLSVNLDILDPGVAPGVGRPESGGWTVRELISVIRGIESLNLVGADIVGLAPAYDEKGEPTALAGAQMVYEILTSMAKTDRTRKANRSTVKS